MVDLSVITYVEEEGETLFRPNHLVEPSLPPSRIWAVPPLRKLRAAVWRRVPGGPALPPALWSVSDFLSDAPWHWADASGEPVILNGFPVGPHKVLIELVNANHQTLDTGVVTFVIPKGNAPDTHH